MGPARRWTLPARAAALGLALALGALAAAGCSKVRGTVSPDRPPETTVWVTGNPDTVSHTVRVFWDGQDPDGFVDAFEFKWIYAPGSEPAGYDSSVWTFTHARDSLFNVHSPHPVDFPTFVVRAIDDHGQRDPTPARQRFAFSNAPPTVDFQSVPPDSSLPVATFGWRATDPDGDASRATFRVWLDGGLDRAATVSGTSFTFPPDLFKNPAGAFEERERTAFVVAIDDGGQASLPDSFSWFVRSPAGDVLLVDDMPSTVAGAATPDAFYRTELTSRVGAGNFTILDLEKGGFFRSPEDLRESFLLFRHVFWYSEANPSFSVPLSMADQPIRDFLSAGGNLFLTGSRLVGSGGALGDDFTREVLGASELRLNQNTGTTNFVISPGQFVIGGPATFGAGEHFDSLQANGIFSGIESFVLDDPGDAAYLAPPGTLDTLHTDDWPVAVSRRYGAAHGRIVYLTFPLRGMNSPFSGVSGRSGIELRKVFDLFGVGPGPATSLDKGGMGW